MSKKVKLGARLLLGVVAVILFISVFWVVNNAPEDKMNGIAPITTPGPRTAEAEMVTLVTNYLPTPAPNPAPSPETTPAKL